MKELNLEGGLHARAAAENYMQLRAEIEQRLRAELDQHQEFAKAKAEGRLVILPCKVGDTVYAVTNHGIIRCKVTEVCLNEGGISFIQLFSDDDRLANFRYEHFCKTVFMSREDAEKALEVQVLERG